MQSVKNVCVMLRVSAMPQWNYVTVQMVIKYGVRMGIGVHILQLNVKIESTQMYCEIGSHWS
jgi:hypothetical protein